MRLSTIQIENFRSFKDQTICLGDYNCFVGPNGTGKSALLMALNVFFRNTASVATNVHTLGEEDFHHRDTSRPIRITLTFRDLSAEAQEDFAHYFRQDQLVIFAQADWDPATESAAVTQYGARRVMRDFAHFFEAVNTGEKVDKLKASYTQILARFPDLPPPTTKAAMQEALRSYEELHPDRCELLPEPNEFYGWTKGRNRLAKHIQWVYVPAVKDASTEQEEGSKTALGQLLQRTIRSKIDFASSLDTMKTELETQYRALLDQEQTALSALEASIQRRLQEWASPAASLSLTWHYDRDRSIVVNEPVARTKIGEDKFIGEVARLGHGMQRAFLLSLLQEMATTGQKGNPTLLLGFEEPELYQHPPQAQHIASVLEQLASRSDRNTQVFVTTHSPYFVSARGFEDVRMFRKKTPDMETTVAAASYQDVRRRLAAAMRDGPSNPSALMTQVEQIMQPSQRELYFSRVAVLVEGLEDVAFISTHLRLRDQWVSFREKGCHFVVVNGKTSLSRPLAIAIELGIPCFVVFDCDSNATKPEDRAKHERDNTCILRLCELDAHEPLPTEHLWHHRLVAWSTTIIDSVRQDVGEDIWNQAEQDARQQTGLVDGVKRKNSLLIAATLEQLAKENVFSALLDKLCNRIQSYAEAVRH